MKKPIEWESTINNKNYAFSYQRVKGKHILTINGVPNTIKVSFFSTLFGFDEKFDLDGIEARLVIERQIPDIVANGIYVKSGKAYRSRPVWATVFAFICIAMPVATLGGALPMVFGLFGGILCIRVSKTSLPIAARIILCTLITLAVWSYFALIINLFWN